MVVERFRLRPMLGNVLRASAMGTQPSSFAAQSVCLTIGLRPCWPYIGYGLVSKQPHFSAFIFHFLELFLKIVWFGRQKVDRLAGALHFRCGA
jgi:hypothetical protein